MGGESGQDSGRERELESRSRVAWICVTGQPLVFQLFLGPLASILYRILASI